MKYAIKPKIVDAIQWKGTNAPEVLDFLKDHGFTNTRVETRPDAPLSIKTEKGYLTVFKDQYIVIHSQDAITSHSEDYFENTYEKAPFQ